MITNKQINNNIKMIDEVIKYELFIFEKIKEHFLNLLKNIKNNCLCLENIELLNQCNNDMLSLIETFKEINKFIVLNPKDENVKQKIKQITMTNQKIKELLPYLLMETIT